jgi:tetratricopeptide (TPR) repeat protein
VFFVGAGISKDPPSCLPLGDELKNEIILAISDGRPKNEVEEILESTKKQRPEVILQIIQDDGLNQRLELLDILKTKKPNQNHYCLARAIKYRNIVITTNFDTLIEYACINEGTQPYVYASEEEFLEWSGTETGVFKIHGTLEDIHGKNRTDTIKVTLRQVGRKLSKAKTNVFETLLKNKDIVFIGYSGLDDFDIYPILLKTQSEKKIFWIEHARNNDPKVHSLKEIKAKKKKDIVDNLFLNRSAGVRVTCNTRRFMVDVWNVVDPGSFTIDRYHEIPLNYTAFFNQWAKSVKYKTSIMAKIYYELGRWDRAAQYYEESLIISKGTGDIRETTGVLRSLAPIYFEGGRLTNALNCLNEALKCADDSGFTIEKARILGNLGTAYSAIGDWERTIKYYEDSLTLFNKIISTEECELETMEKERAWMLIGMGNAYVGKSVFDKAQEYYSEASGVFTKLGDIQGKSLTLGSLANVCARIEESSKAVQYYNESLEISKTIGDKRREVETLINLELLHLKNRKWVDVLRVLWLLRGKWADALGMLRMYYIARKRL